MTTFIIYNNDTSKLEDTINSILKVSNDVCIIVTSDPEYIKKLEMVTTTYAVILHAGDIVEQYLPYEYCEILVSDVDDKPYYRGTRFGKKVLSKIMYLSSDDLTEYIVDQSPQRSDVIKFNINRKE